MFTLKRIENRKKVSSLSFAHLKTKRRKVEKKNSLSFMQMSIELDTIIPHSLSPLTALRNSLVSLIRSMNPFPT
jgi:hypothetical protein